MFSVGKEMWGFYTHHFVTQNIFCCVVCFITHDLRYLKPERSAVSNGAFPTHFRESGLSEPFFKKEGNFIIRGYLSKWGPLHRLLIINRGDAVWLQKRLFYFLFVFRSSARLYRPALIISFFKGSLCTTGSWSFL